MQRAFGTPSPEVSLGKKIFLLSRRKQGHLCLQEDQLGGLFPTPRGRDRAARAFSNREPSWRRSYRGGRGPRA
jgi:hypothetical protein